MLILCIIIIILAFNLQSYYNSIMYVKVSGHCVGIYILKPSSIPAYIIIYKNTHM